jgi:hypothetical protein
MWFPFSSLAGPGTTERTYMHSGWISKNMVLAHKDFISKIHSNIRHDGQHSDPVARLHAHRDSKITFSIKEVSTELFKLYEADPGIAMAEMHFPVCPEDIEFINTWMVKGLRVLYPDKTLPNKGPEPKPLTPEEEAVLRSMFV